MKLEEIFADIGEKIVNDAKSILKAKKKIASGDLYNSLKYKIEGDKLLFEMAAYGKWVDQGRKPGKYVPVNELNKWLKIRNIDLKYSFVINRAIKNKGIKPTFFFTTPFDTYSGDIDKAVDDYVQAILDEYLVE